MDEASVRQEIDEVFSKAKNQFEALSGVYRLFMPDGRAILLTGRPFCGSRLYRLVAGKFQEFDYRHHPKAFPGGLWLSQGFRESVRLDPFEVDWKPYLISRNETDCYG